MLRVRPDWLVSTSRVFEYMQRVAESYSSVEHTFDDSGVVVRLLFRKKMKMIKQLKSERMQYELDFLPYFREQMETMGCSGTVDQINRILGKKDKLTWDVYIEMQRALHDRVVDDLSHGEFFLVPPHRHKYFLDAKILFGEDVNRSFPSAIKDIEEAGKCFAFGRNTAMVFHLMRVMELGLRALGASLHDSTLDPRTNPSWNTILRRCMRELELPINDRSQDWKQDNEFFSTATANLRAVKDAWRNPTMHIDRDYDEEEALDVLNAVKAFTRHLAVKLHE